MAEVSDACSYIDRNGIVTFTEIFDHVSDNVRAATNGRQNPQRSGFGDIPLAVVGRWGRLDRQPVGPSR